MFTTPRVAQLQLTQRHKRLPEVGQVLQLVVRSYGSGCCCLDPPHNFRTFGQGGEQQRSVAAARRRRMVHRDWLGSRGEWGEGNQPRLNQSLMPHCGGWGVRKKKCRQAFSAWKPSTTRSTQATTLGQPANQTEVAPSTRSGIDGF